jgi:hypothetical protein
MKKRLRIAILIRDYKNLGLYELQTINYILSDNDLELVLLIKDGRINVNSLIQKLKSNLWTRRIIANLLFKLQCFIEARLYPRKNNFLNKIHIFEELLKIPSIYLHPIRKGYLDIFSDEESAQVKNYDLDIILRHEFGIIRGKILESAKHGIWSFHHGDNSVNRGGPAGFWEIVLNEPYVGVTLQKLTSILDGGLVIDKAFYNWNFSYVSTQNDILISSIELLKKNIKKLKKNKITYKKSSVYYNQLYRKPDLKNVLLYLWKFYSQILKKIQFALVAKILNKNRNSWSLIFSKGIFLESQLFNKKEINMPKGEFWADPFLINYDKDLYVFFENYNYNLRRGKISCAKIIDDKFTDVRDVLSLDYHLSYPFLIQDGVDIFMIPETQENRRLEVYKCVNFPQQWELYSIAFEGEEIVDTSYLVDDNGDKWLFINKGYINKPELHIYKIDSLRLNEIEEHAQNPVSIDCQTARNGGSIFKYNNEFYRPSQLNTNGKYGNGLNISRIVELSLDEFVEEKVITVLPRFKKGISGIHHLHQINNAFVFDVFRKIK